MVAYSEVVYAYFYTFGYDVTTWTSNHPSDFVTRSFFGF